MHHYQINRYVTLSWKLGFNDNKAWAKPRLTVANKNNFKPSLYLFKAITQTRRRLKTFNIFSMSYQTFLLYCQPQLFSFYIGGEEIDSDCPVYTVTRGLFLSSLYCYVRIDWWFQLQYLLLLTNLILKINATFEFHFLVQYEFFVCCGFNGAWITQTADASLLLHRI